MPPREVRHYTTANGRDAIATFLDELSAKAAAKCSAMIERLESGEIRLYPKNRTHVMKHDAYVAERGRRDPRFDSERKAAAAELALGELLVRQRNARNLSIAQLAETVGIPEKRLAAIEGGESLTFHEVLWLVHALEIPISIDADFTIASGVPKGGKQATEVTTLSSTAKRSPKAATA